MLLVDGQAAVRIWDFRRVYSLSDAQGFDCFLTFGIRGEFLRVGEC